MNIGIMQPYIFPYIGYFQLVNAVDVFVFYDDVNFIKKGFINKNHILLNNQKFTFTISCKKISQNKKINEIELNFDTKERLKLVNNLKHCYKDAPYFDTVYPLLHDFFHSYQKQYVSDMAIDSIQFVSDFIGLGTQFVISSERFGDSQSLKKEHRLRSISQQLNASHYINPIGGIALYEKAYFDQQHIQLQFLKSRPIIYKQFTDDFVPWLSIIDVMMFNSKEQIKQILNEFDLI